MNFPFDYIWRIARPPCHVERSGFLFHSDFQAILPQLASESIDLILTDPPYGIRYSGPSQKKLKPSHKNFLYGKTHSLPRIANDSMPAAIEIHELFLLDAKRILRPGGCCCCFCSSGGGSRPLFPRWVDLLAKHLDYKQTIVWDKGGLGMGTHYRNNFEFVLIAKKPGAKCKWNGGYKTSNIIRINRPHRRRHDHPTPKPVNLLEYFIQLHSNKNDIILDPFAGQGPTLIAAKLLNRKFIGIELESIYCKAASQKLLGLDDDFL